jgi:hypothetical protein
LLTTMVSIKSEYASCWTKGWNELRKSWLSWSICSRIHANLDSREVVVLYLIKALLINLLLVNCFGTDPVGYKRTHRSEELEANRSGPVRGNQRLSSISCNTASTDVLPLFGNIRCFSFVKWMYLDIF